MKLAAIDIGSNAMRLQIVTVYEENDLVSFKKLEYLRFPLRLGKEVFQKGRISAAVQERYLKLMQTFKLLIDLYEVEAYYAVATSAMREAANGEAVRDTIAEQIGLDIHIISGEEEARMLSKAIVPYLNKGYSIHIDVGGGSTELNLYQGTTLLGGQSFRMGSVRKLSKVDRHSTFERISKWLKQNNITKAKPVVGIGTGGNINKLFKLARQNNNSSITMAELRGTKAYLSAFTYKERISILKLNPDRADVIIPASEIYLHILEAVKGDRILVPRVGLKDGILYELYEQTTQKSILKIEYLQSF